MGPAQVETPHLLPSVIAIVAAGAILVAGEMFAVYLEQRAIRWVDPQVFQLKNQGLAFQRAAAHTQDVLLLYGSSELIMGPIAERGGYFFRTAPTGFQLSPVGKPGATAMTILQKIGALGSDLRGKKVAISLSPVWFLMPGERADWYEGNFSLLAASELAFGSALDFELKRDIASRMLQFPSTLEKSPLLEFALRRLASGGWFDRVVFCAIWPIGKAYTAALELQDHFAAVAHILYGTRAAPVQTSTRARSVEAHRNSERSQQRRGRQNRKHACLG